MRRHPYRLDFGTASICVCGKARSHDVHDLMVWQRSVKDGFWYAQISGIQYRCRTRPRGRAIWWPEYQTIGDDDWIEVGFGLGTALALAKDLCEEHREAREIATESPLAALARRWEAEGYRLRNLYFSREEYPHMNGLADQMIACADELRKELGNG